MKTIYLGGGCFWCTEAVFRSLRGVQEVVPGYMGGTLPNPSYEAVCTGETGHAEVIKVYYDENIIGTDDLLDVFFETHDPTTVNRQGADVGTQYRSIIFHTDDQEPGFRGGEPDDLPSAIQRAIDRANKDLPDGASVVTEIASATEFYPAEEYHYNYYAAHTDAPYCQLVISPKLDKLHKKFSDKIV